jgi:secreted trypsin-like serine protease
VNGHAPTSWVGGSVAVVEWQSADQASAFRCSGTLVATNWVLTAAHCAIDDATGAAYDLAGYRVAIGDGPVSLRTDWLTVDAAVAHPSYQYGAFDWDAALLRLAGTGSQRPTIDLLDPADASAGGPGAAATALGWGATDGTAQTVPDRLLETGMRIGSAQACAAALGTDFTANQVCATADPGTSCSGDSGGPLLVFGSDGYPFLDTGSSTTASTAARRTSRPASPPPSRSGRG